MNSMLEAMKKAGMVTEDQAKKVEEEKRRVETERKYRERQQAKAELQAQTSQQPATVG